MRSRSPFPMLLAATAAACALLPAAAHAATLTLEGNTIVYRGEGSEGLSLLLTSQDDNGTKYLSFYDSGADRQIFDSSICHTSQYSSGALCVLDPNRPIRIEGSEGKDSISIFSAGDVPDSVPITVDGKGGDDQIKDAYDSSTGRTFSGGAGNDKIEAYGGNDVIDGGDGNDEVDGGEGDDEVHGGAGDDVLFGDHYKTPGADVLDGGPGYDQVDEWSIPDAPVHPLPTVSLNGAADDGRPGEGDNVQSVEQFTFHVNTTFTGGDAAEKVEVLNVDEGSSNLDGGGGNDILKAYDTNDTVNGGAGDDQIEGGLGNDVVTGGPGKDMIMGDATASHCGIYSCKIPFDNDTIYAQDGEPDQIDCGIGDDGDQEGQAVGPPRAPAEGHADRDGHRRRRQAAAADPLGDAQEVGLQGRFRREARVAAGVNAGAVRRRIAGTTRAARRAGDATGAGSGCRCDACPW